MSNSTDDQVFNTLIENNFDSKQAIAVLAVCLDDEPEARQKFNEMQDLDANDLPIVDKELTLDDLTHDQVGEVLNTIVQPVTALGRMDFVVLVQLEGNLHVLHPMFGSLS